MTAGAPRRERERGGGPGLSRRSFCGLALAGAASLTLGCRAARPPNVLFVALDDLNDWTGCLGGHPQALTPNLDRLAAEGVLFTNAHCPAPMCGGSRAAILAGLEPWSSGMYTFQSPREVLPDRLTLPQHFRRAGYRAWGGGKIFHHADEGSWDETFLPLPRDEKLRPLAGWGFGRRRQPKSFNWGPVEAGDDELFDGKVAAWAAEKLAAPHEAPFFLAVGFLRPHLPWYAPKPYFEPFPPPSVALPEVWDGDLRDLPTTARLKVPRRVHRRVVAAGQWQHAVAAYLASSHYMDAMLGRVLAALEGGPHAGRTLVALWSDHGHHLGEKEHWSKFVLWERATRVPLVVKAPGVTTAGGRTDAPVTLTSLFPTLLELAGIEPPERMDGTSLTPLLEDPAADWPHAAVIVDGGDYAVCDRRWRYIRYADGGEELYDHRHDPREWLNMAAGPPLYAEVKEALARRLPADPAPPAPGSRPQPAWPGEERPGGPAAAVL